MNTLPAAQRLTGAGACQLPLRTAWRAAPGPVWQAAAGPAMPFPKPGLAAGSGAPDLGLVHPT